MDRRIAEWKLELDRIWSAHEPDHGEAVRLAQQIANSSEDEALRQAASQALPILRAAAQEGADHATSVAARRRLGVIRDVLAALTTPQFGRRQAAPKSLTAEERFGCRSMAGCPNARFIVPTSCSPSARIRMPAAAPRRFCGYRLRTRR